MKQNVKSLDGENELLEEGDSAVKINISDTERSRVEDEDGKKLSRIEQRTISSKAKRQSPRKYPNPQEYAPKIPVV